MVAEDPARRLRRQGRADRRDAADAADCRRLVQRPCPRCWPRRRWTSAASSPRWSRAPPTARPGPGRWSHTIQVDGVCDEVIAPAPDLPDERRRGRRSEAALRIADDLGVTGVLAVELFETPGVGAGFLVNELAMRPHNTGHWTMDGAVTSQFEQHLRAVLDLPLGATAPSARSVMKNFLGGDEPDLFSGLPTALAAEPRAKVHATASPCAPAARSATSTSSARRRRRRFGARPRRTVAAIIRDGAPGSPKMSNAR